MLDVVKAVVVIVDKEKSKISDEEALKCVDNAFLKRIMSFEEKDAVSRQ